MLKLFKLYNSLICLNGLYSLNTRIMVSKGMVSKSKYSITEKNKGMPVSICPYF